MAPHVSLDHLISDKAAEFASRVSATAASATKRKKYGSKQNDS